MSATLSLEDKAKRLLAIKVLRDTLAQEYEALRVDFKSEMGAHGRSKWKFEGVEVELKLHKGGTKLKEELLLAAGVSAEILESCKVKAEDSHYLYVREPLSEEKRIARREATNNYFIAKHVGRKIAAGKHKKKLHSTLI